MFGMPSRTRRSYTRAMFQCRVFVAVPVGCGAMAWAARRGSQNTEQRNIYNISVNCQTAAGPLYFSALFHFGELE